MTTIEEDESQLTDLKARLAKSKELEITVIATLRQQCENDIKAYLDKNKLIFDQTANVVIEIEKKIKEKKEIYKMEHYLQLENRDPRVIDVTKYLPKSDPATLKHRMALSDFLTLMDPSILTLKIQAYDLLHLVGDNKSFGFYLVYPANLETNQELMVVSMPHAHTWIAEIIPLFKSKTIRTLDDIVKLYDHNLALYIISLKGRMYVTPEYYTHDDPDGYDGTFEDLIQLF